MVDMRKRKMTLRGNAPPATKPQSAAQAGGTAEALFKDIVMHTFVRDETELWPEAMQRGGHIGSGSEPHLTPAGAEPESRALNASPQASTPLQARVPARRWEHVSRIMMQLCTCLM